MAGCCSPRMVRLGPATTAACSPPATATRRPRPSLGSPPTRSVWYSLRPYLREAIDDDERRRLGRDAAIATALTALGYGLIGALGSAVVGLTTQAVSGATMLAFYGWRLPRITGLSAILPGF